MIRSELCLMTAELLKSSKKVAISVASSIEFLHEASLCHDDIQDGQCARRGRPTLWKAHGTNQAINLGDLLQNLAIRPLLDLHSEHLPVLLKHLNRVVCEVIQGQIHEQHIINCIVSRREYEQVCRLKTASLMAAGPELLCLAAGQTNRFAEVSKSFHHLGLAFQYENDLKDLQKTEKGLDFSNSISSAPTVILLEKLYHLGENVGLKDLFSDPKFYHQKIKEHKIEAQVRSMIDRELEHFFDEMSYLGSDWEQSFRRLIDKVFAAKVSR
jgi:geranylgeranyl pyrophosphate synthase